MLAGGPRAPRWGAAGGHGRALVSGAASRWWQGWCGCV
ncbi:hypothetical protein BU14_0031s0118 [Porphyra umbilicalis]|uniref:Uncharacterized protein n=1 Tax=Porphyra umbilicalis TaxID=2786 RepID=A0A1X6PJ87_PORUM|nr:hypothetical protein BU14_0031s0118 [Porphyra umbilicalis]|eukprot:OSX80949.1 hypothetical protein BU14_0031s0118 [Porphyra umbilicalis]